MLGAKVVVYHVGIGCIGAGGYPMHTVWDPIPIQYQYQHDRRLPWHLTSHTVTLQGMLWGPPSPITSVRCNIEVPRYPVTNIPEVHVVWSFPAIIHYHTHTVSIQYGWLGGLGGPHTVWV